MISWKKDTILTARVKAMVLAGYSSGEIGLTVKLSKNQIIGFCAREGLQLKGHRKGNQHTERTYKKEPPREILIEGSNGIIARQCMDKSRITLKHIPSIEAWQESTGYSYTSQDRSSDS